MMKSTGTWRCIQFTLATTMLTGIWLWAICGIYMLRYNSDNLQGFGLSEQPPFLYHNKTRPLIEAPGFQKYITSCGFRGKLGNQMFEYASMKGIGNLTNRTAFLITPPNYVSNAFKGLELDIRMGRKNITEYNEIRHDIVASIGMLKTVPEDEICVCCYLQSPLYFQNIKKDIRAEYTFHDDIVVEASAFLQMAVPSDWVGTQFTRVGIHVRRRDLLTYKLGISKGFHFPSTLYFEKAISMFKKQFSRVQFVVASDDINWCKDLFKSWNDTFAFSMNKRPAVDMAILSQCDHVIITMGTFSWWIGWLNKGTTVYYEGFRLNGSKLATIWRNEQYIPQKDIYNNWIGLTD